MLDDVAAIHEAVVHDVPLAPRRYLYEQVNWNGRAICLLGARGVGKTTMLLQYYHDVYGDVDKCLYLSADNIHVISGGLFATVQEYFRLGGKAIIIDEVHRYPDWSIEVKNILDTYRNKQVLLSGSSATELARSKADLSRRVVYHRLSGLSFREYLLFDRGIALPAKPLPDLLDSHRSLSSLLSEHDISLRDFHAYLQHGYYPYFLESKHDYPAKVHNVIEKVLFQDLAVVYNLRQPKLPVLKKLLWLVATSQPFVPNMDRMSRDLRTSKEYLYNYLEELELAGLIANLRAEGTGLRMVRKPGKVLLDNTNLVYALTGSLRVAANQGAVRETFFSNQLRAAHSVTVPAHGDFLIDSRFLFEIGGKNKTSRQIRDEPESYLACEGIDVGHGKRIPLHLFGFLY
ncbi:MAG: AAA family ATPase [Chitinivibrionales bacterium]|nr:AAA family ATPase [Chitinivibrionales bacterium]